MTVLKCGGGSVIVEAPEGMCHAHTVPTGKPHVLFPPLGKSVGGGKKRRPLTDEIRKLAAQPTRAYKRGSTG